jgi:hypothetical protein
MGNGTLQLAVIMNPFGEWDPNKGDHHTDLEIEEDEWCELFYKVLGVPERWKEVDGQLEPVEFSEAQFKEILTGKGYPMLGRIWFMYRDANYLPSEVSKLLEECLKIQKKTENVSALSALGKLIAACYEAIKINSGLCLLSD